MNPTPDSGPDGGDVALRAPVLEHAGDVLLADLRAGRGVAAVNPALELFRRRWAMRRVVAVVDDDGSRQVFAADTDGWPPPETFDAKPGLHTDPIVPESAGEMVALSDLCALAVQLERLNHETVHDPMTGLYNRRGFNEHMGQAVSRSTRYGWTFALVLFDVDDFKRVNDTRGHPYGDEVLREIGRRLQASLRGGDVAARLGGDEFALLLADADADAAPPVLERITVRTADGAEPLQVGLSAGAATCPLDAATAEALYTVADQRLYQSKARRKGMTVSLTNGPTQ